MRLSVIFLVIWIVFICWATLTPSDGLPESRFFDFPYFDKIAHFGLFSIFSFILSHVLEKAPGQPFAQKNELLIIVISTLIFSCIIEITQIFIPGRDFEITDIIANLIGCFAGYATFELKLKYFSNLN